MADDTTEGIELVAAVLERSDLTEADVEELQVLLKKLEDELKVYRDLDDLSGLRGRGYKRVTRAPGGIVSVRRYLEWREEQREIGTPPDRGPADE